MRRHPQCFRYLWKGIKLLKHCIIALIALSCVRADADDTTRIPLTVYLQGGLTSPIARSLYCLDDVACPPFTSGLGMNADILLSTERPLGDNTALLGGIGAGLWTTVMRSIDNAGRTRDADGNVVEFLREQTMEARGEHIAAFIGASYAYDKLRVFAGPRFEFALGTPTWKQTSRIISPANVTYPNGAREIASLDQRSIPESRSFRIYGMIGASYSIDVAPSISLAPYMAASYTPMSLRSTADWTDLRVALGLSLSTDVVTINRAPVYVDTITVRPEVVIVEPAAVDTMLNVQAPFKVLSTSVDTIPALATFSIRVSSEKQSQLFSLLPYIFFDSASAVIPARYNRLTSSATHRQSWSATDQHAVYCDILNIIGSRLQGSSDTLHITGYADSSSEGGSCTLAHERANAIKQYLLRVWNINDQRLMVHESGAPCTPKDMRTSVHALGRQENRRVELRTSSVNGVRLSSNTAEPTSDIPVAKQRLSLAMFSLGSSTLSQRDSLLLREFARELQTGNRIRVYGYTDNMGPVRINLSLSQERANVVSAYIHLLRPDCSIESAVGLGSQRYPQGIRSYQYPEERFMSRTVQVEVAGR